MGCTYPFVKPRRRSEKREEIARDILRYLTTYPDAQDTMDGILYWWLLHQKITYQAHAVRNALNTLVESDLLIELDTPGSPLRYRVNKSRKDEIARVLTQENEDGKD